MSMRGVAVVAALAAAGSVFADTHNVADGATDTPNGFTGTFDKSALPSSWDVKYSADGKSVYLRYLKGTILMFM